MYLFTWEQIFLKSIKCTQHKSLRDFIFTFLEGEVVSIDPFSVHSVLHIIYTAFISVSLKMFFVAFGSRRWLSVGYR